MAKRVEITENDIQAMQARINRATGRAHRLLATEIWGNIREFAPQDHGRLAGSFHLSGGDHESTIGTAVEYAAVQNQGRGPYYIYPKNGPYLTFKIGGGWVKVKRVKHPGIKATRYVERSIEAAQNRIPTFVATALRKEGLA